MLSAGTEALRKVNPGITMGKTRCCPTQLSQEQDLLSPQQSSQGRITRVGTECILSYKPSLAAGNHSFGISPHKCSSQGFSILSWAALARSMCVHSIRGQVQEFYLYGCLSLKARIPSGWPEWAQLLQFNPSLEIEIGEEILQCIEKKKNPIRKARKYSRSPNTHPGRATALETTPFGLENFKWEFLPPDCSRCLAVLSTHSNPWAKLSSDL